MGSRGPFCPSCYYLGQQLQTKIHTKHLPSDCPRKALAVNMLKMEDFEHFQDEGKIYNPPVLSNKHLNDVQVLKTSLVANRHEQKNPDHTDFIVTNQVENKKK